MEDLTPLQGKVLAHMSRLCIADVVLAHASLNAVAPEGDGKLLTCFLARIPRTRLDRASEERFNASALELAPECRLALEHDVTLRLETRPVVLDAWPEKRFLHPETLDGESAWDLNCCRLEIIGKDIDALLTELLGRLELLFDGWHLAPEAECEKRHSMESRKAMWEQELYVQQCLAELEAEREE